MATAARKAKRNSKTRSKRTRTKLPKRSKKKSRATAKKTKSKVKKASKRQLKKKTKKASRKNLVKKASPKKSRAKVLNLPMAAMVKEPAIKVGDKAPDFRLSDQYGNPVSLGNFLGRKVVLYFYPKDDTPGCTREACSFRDHLQDFQGLDAEIIGVSFDDKESHQKFIEKYGLNFTLLSDTEKEAANKYGVYVQKNMYGKTYMGIERSTFVIDRNGVVVAAFRNVKVDGHTDEVMGTLKRID